MIYSEPKQKAPPLIDLCKPIGGVLSVYFCFALRFWGCVSLQQKEFRSCGSDQDAVLDLPPFEKGGPKLCAPAALERQAAVGAEGTAKGSIKKWFF